MTPALTLRLDAIGLLCMPSGILVIRIGVWICNTRSGFHFYEISMLPTTVSTRARAMMRSILVQLSQFFFAQDVF